MNTITEKNQSSRWTVRLADVLAKRRRAKKAGQKGMTLLEIMIVLAILALVMGLVVGPRVLAMFGESKGKIATATVKKYVFEAYPQWSMNNTGKQCPGQLTDLNTYMNNADGKDPWGNPYKMLCGSNLPAGAKGMAVISAGEDGKEGTADDIKSWE
jgi:general secretion pathway protein G